MSLAAPSTSVYQCACGGWQPLWDLYYCEPCKRALCTSVDCSRAEIEAYACPHCQATELYAGAVFAARGRCVRACARACVRACAYGAREPAAMAACAQVHALLRVPVVRGGARDGSDARCQRAAGLLPALRALPLGLQRGRRHRCQCRVADWCVRTRMGAGARASGWGVVVVGAVTAVPCLAACSRRDRRGGGRSRSGVLWGGAAGGASCATGRRTASVGGRWVGRRRRRVHRARTVARRGARGVGGRRGRRVRAREPHDARGAAGSGAETPGHGGCARGGRGTRGLRRRGGCGARGARGGAAAASAGRRGVRTAAVAARSRRAFVAVARAAARAQDAALCGVRRGRVPPGARRRGHAALRKDRDAAGGPRGAVQRVCAARRRSGGGAVAGTTTTTGAVVVWRCRWRGRGGRRGGCATVLAPGAGARHVSAGCARGRCRVLCSVVGEWSGGGGGGDGGALPAVCVRVWCIVFVWMRVGVDMCPQWEVRAGVGAQGDDPFDDEDAPSAGPGPGEGALRPLPRRAWHASIRARVRAHTQRTHARVRTHTTHTHAHTRRRVVVRRPGGGAVVARVPRGARAALGRRGGGGAREPLDARRAARARVELVCEAGRSAVVE